MNQVVLDVLYPTFKSKVIEEMKGIPYSVSIDGSRHGDTKMVPIVVRYWPFSLYLISRRF